MSFHADSVTVRLGNPIKNELREVVNNDPEIMNMSHALRVAIIQFIRNKKAGGAE